MKQKIWVIYIQKIWALTSYMMTEWAWSNKKWAFNLFIKAERSALKVYG